MINNVVGKPVSYLALNLLYDKEHNGMIKAESKEGEGSKFLIQLPV